MIIHPLIRNGFPHSRIGQYLLIIGLIQIGEQRISAVMPAVFRIIGQGMIAIVPVLMCCILFPSLVLSVYTNDITLSTAAVPALMVVCVAAVAMVVGMPLFEAVSGTGNTTKALILESLVLVAYTFSVWFFAGYLKLSVEWVWTSEFTYGATLGIFSYLYLRLAKWQHKKI